jgi:CHAT domain-containing protein
LNKTTSSPIIKAFCTQCSTRLRKLIRKAKHLCYSELIKHPETKIKRYGRQQIRKLVNLTLQRTFPMEMNFGNRFQIKPTNVFIKYYLNIIYNRKIQQANIESTKFSLKEAFCQGFAEIISIPITESEVKCIFKILKNKNSSGYDRISNKNIKAGCDHFSKPLTCILNMSPTQGIYSDRPNTPS